MQVHIKKSITDIQFPAVITPLKNQFPQFDKKLIKLGNYKIPVMNNILESFSLTLIDLPPTTVVLNSIIEFILYATKHKLSGWLIDKNYDFYQLPLGISGLVCSFEILKESSDYILCKNAPYLLVAPYSNIEKFPYAVTFYYDNMYYCVGYAAELINNKIINM